MPEKIRVLYVDDESALLEIGKQFLEQSGDFTITTATSGPDAIRLLEQESFDTIVSDYQMPGMDGIQFLVLVRTKFGQIPFILFTGKGREEVVIAALNAGADGYLQKGGDPGAQFAELSHKIKTAASRKRADDAVKRSEENYRHLIEHSDEAIIVVQDGMPKLVNHRAVEFTGYSEQELLSMSISAFIHPDDRALVMERYQKRMKGEDAPSRYTLRLGSKDGSTRWVEISISTIDWDGRPATLNFLTDITERKKADAALVESEEKFRVIADYTVNWESWFGPDGKYIWVSPSVAQFTGYSDGEILAMPDFISTVIVEEDRPLFTERFREAIGGASGENFEFRYLHRNGTKHWLNVSWQPIVDRNGNSIGTRASGHDITERKQAEDALRYQNEMRQTILDSIPVMVAFFDREGHYQLINRCWQSTLGWSLEEMLQHKDVFAEFYPDPEYRKYVMDYIKNAEGAGLWSDFKTRIRDGHVLDTSWINVPLSDGSIIGLGIDITERKRAEEALRKSEEKFKYISELIPDFAYSCTKEPGGGFAIDWITGAPEPITGYTTEEIKRMTCWKFLVIDEDIPVFEKNVTGLLPGEFARCELRIRRKDGGIIWLSSYTQCVTDLKEPGNHCLYGACRDITDRKLAEDALQKSEEKYRQLVELAEEGVWAIDAENNTTYLNPRMAEMLQYTVDEMQGLPILSFMDDAGKKIFAQNMHGLQQGIAEVLPFEFITKGGSRIYATISASSLTDDKGTYQGSIAVISDITERKRADEALRQANKQLNLLSDITRHDITNQLLVLRGYLKLSHDVIDKPETLKEFIKKEQQAANTIDEQITFTRDYQNLGVAAPAWQNVNECIRNAMVALPLRAVHIEADPADPEVYADPLFDKVFYNLIDNALRYGGDQMKTIRVFSQESDTSLAIVCEDDGVGISDEDKKKLFRKGFGKHTGLGLFLSREILSITGITITENGTPGKGARFGITVPKWAYHMNPDTGYGHRGEI